MNICILLALVYIIGGVGILIMKKLQPEDKIYPVWVAAICVILTCFVVWHVILGAILFNPEFAESQRSSYISVCRDSRSAIRFSGKYISARA